MLRAHSQRLFISLVALFMLSSPAYAEKQKAILVLDASGSMWGQIEDKTKIEIAREAIAGVLKGWDASSELGLVVYGHRTKGDCSDIETLIPVGKLNQVEFNKTIGKLNPKGKTPLTAAVLQAAEQLKYTEDKATVILVSDGKETCHADPCVASKEMAKAGVDFTVHVVGFDVVEKTGVNQLRCLAENTGGEYLTAKNAAGLKLALGKAVKKVVKPEVGKVPDGPIGHKFYVSLKKDGKPLISISDGWYLYNSGGEEQDNKKKKTKTSQAQPLFSNLDKGKYQAILKHGYAQAQTDFEVKGPQDSVVHHLSLNAGLARFKAAMTTGSDPLTSISDGWYIYSSEVDELGNHKKIGSTGAAQPTLVLPQGRYHIVVNHGYGSAEGDIEVKAGEVSDLSLDLKMGSARFKVAMAESKGPLTSVSDGWYIYSSEVDKKGNRKKIGSTGAAQPTLVFSQGEYHIVVNHGYGSAEGDIEVKAGETSDLFLSLNAGFAQLKVAIAEGKDPLTSINNYWYVYSSEVDEKGNRKKIGSTGAAQPKLVLPQGKYLATVDHNKLSAEGSFEVKAGSVSDLILILSSGK